MLSRPARNRNRILERARQRARNNPINRPVLTGGDLAFAVLIAVAIVGVATSSLWLFGEFVVAVQ